MEAAPCIDCGTTRGSLGGNKAMPYRCNGRCSRCRARHRCTAARRAAGAKPVPTWRPHEKAYLRRHYAKKRTDWLAARFGRTEVAVRQQAKRMGLCRREKVDRASERQMNGTAADRIRDIRRSRGLDRPEPVELDRARYAALATEARRAARRTA